MKKKRILVFASGGPGPEDGGSGFVKMVEFSRIVSDAVYEVVGVVSNYEWGGVRTKADALGVSFRYWPGPFTAKGYRKLVEEFQADYVMLSGWLKLVRGLLMETTLNIHPGVLPMFGGPGMYGDHVHQATMEAYKRGEVTHSAVSMHFVNEEFDKGPVFFECQIPIQEGWTWQDMKSAVNAREHKWQSLILNEVVKGNIRLIDGKVFPMKFTEFEEHVASPRSFRL
jgi:phosphoribosylglycinamide formyltransferase-1